MKDLQKKISRRLYYRPITDSHFGFIEEFLGSPEQTRYLPLGKPYPKQDIIEYFNKRIDHWCRKQFGTFIIYMQEATSPVGYCGLEYVKNTDFIDIRYGIKQEVWGKGYGGEAARWCLDFGFHQLGLQTIYGAAEHGNMGSLKILKSIGMKSCDDVNFYGDVVEYFKMEKNDYPPAAVYSGQRCG